MTFDTPQAFETALITLGTRKQAGPNALAVTDGGQTLRIAYRADGGTLAIGAEAIEEDLPLKQRPTRIALRFQKPVRKAAIPLTIAPASP